MAQKAQNIYSLSPLQKKFMIPGPEAVDPVNSEVDRSGEKKFSHGSLVILRRD